MYKQLANLRNKNKAQRTKGQKACKRVLMAHNQHVDRWSPPSGPAMQTRPRGTLEPPGKAQPAPLARVGPLASPGRLAGSQQYRK